MSLNDQALLRHFIHSRSDQSFRKIVDEHLSHVLGVAYRVTRDQHMAEDIAQIVFTRLSRRAKSLTKYRSLSAWLHTTTRALAVDTIRSQDRRQQREAKSLYLNAMNSNDATTWADLEPELDSLIARLSEPDRQAVLLRFYHQKSHAEIGKVLGVAENTARMRVTRSLDRLRILMRKRGIVTTTAALATLIPAHSLQVAPVGLATSITSQALVAVSPTTFLTPILLMTKSTITTVVVTAIIASFGTAFVMNQSEPVPPETASTLSAPDHSKGRQARTPSRPESRTTSKSKDRKKRAKFEAIEERDTMSFDFSSGSLQIDAASFMASHRKKELSKVSSLLQKKLNLTEGQLESLMEHPNLSEDKMANLTDALFREALAETVTEEQLSEYDELVDRSAKKTSEQLALKDYADLNRAISGLSKDQQEALYDHFYEKRQNRIDANGRVFGSNGSVLSGSYRGGMMDGPMNSLGFGRMLGSTNEEVTENTQKLAAGEVTQQELFEQSRAKGREKAVEELGDILNEDQLAEYSTALEEANADQQISFQSFGGDGASAIITTEALNAIPSSSVNRIQIEAPSSEE